jgi:hypothetical protein
MSPDGKVRGRRAIVASNIYTALLALALGAVCSAAGFVVFKCFVQYETILKIVQVAR